MGAITDIDDLTNKLTGGNNGNPEAPWIFKTEYLDDAVTITGTAVLNQHYSFWRHSGNPSSGAAPGGTARNPTNATLGAFPFTNPGGGRQKWLTGLSFAVNAGNVGAFFYADRLADISGLSGDSASTQNTTSLSVSRFTDGLDNELWIEIYTQIGATGRTVTATYTDDTNTSRVTPAVVIGGTGFREVGRFIRLPLHASSRGIKSCQSIILSAGTGTAGDIGVTITHPLGMLENPVAPHVAVRNYAVLEMPPRELQTNAAVMVYCLPAAGATATNYFMTPSTVEA